VLRGKSRKRAGDRKGPFWTKNKNADVAEGAANSLGCVKKWRLGERGDGHGKTAKTQSRGKGKGRLQDSAVPAKKTGGQKKNEMGKNTVGERKHCARL